MNKKPLLGLCMIVRDEAARIAEVLQSYRSIIDYFTVLDTGSTDGTQAIIRRELADIPGAIHEGPFVDFATARNRALELHGQRTVFSIMPNGDRLEGSSELRAFLEAHRSDDINAYQIRIKPGHYYLPLVLRTDSGWRYYGRTHEIPMGPGSMCRVPGVALDRDRSARTSEQWRQRWLRDRVLLEETIAEKPDDERSWFYLAQTLEGLGEQQQALAAYRKRGDLGGYFDERFEAKLRIGKILTELAHPWPEIQAAYLDAYAFDIRRAEPLFRIAEHWYDKSHALTYLFASRAAELPKPATNLFLDEEIYTWRAADLAAISGYYLNDPHAKIAGRKFAEQCVRVHRSDERLRANWAFYAPSAAEMFQGYASKPIGFTPEAPYIATNPSIYFEPDAWRCILRTVNYKIVDGRYYWPDGDSAIRTRNFMLDLDENLGVVKATEMIDKTGGSRSTYPVHGFEDCRLFKHYGKLCFTATVCDFDLEKTAEGPREIVLGELNDDYAIVKATPLRGPWSVHSQKNWMPVSGVYDGRAAIVYATSSDGERSATMLALGPGIAEGATAMPLGHGRLRGGSQLVCLPEGWLCIVHDVTWAGNGRIYLHRFVLLSLDFKIVSMTDPFYFERKGIEFCAGLARDGDRLVASFGVEDKLAMFGVFELDAVRAQLRTDYQI